MTYSEDFDYNKPFTPKMWGKMWPFIKPHRRHILSVAGFMMMVALIDVFIPLLSAYIIDNFIRPRTMEGMWPFIALSCGMALAQAFGVYLFVKAGTQIEVRISESLRSAVFNHLQKLSFSYYNVTPVGYMMARAMSDTSRIGELVVWGLIDTSWSLLYAIGVFVSMFLLNWRLALIVLCTVPPLIFATWFFQSRILRLNRVVRKINSQMTGAMNEGITGARTTKTLVIEEQNNTEFRAVTGDLKRNATRIAWMRGLFGPLIMFIGSLAAAFVLSQGGSWLLGGSFTAFGLSIGLLSAFMSYTTSIFEPISQIAHTVSEFIATQVNIERVTGLLEHEPDITDSPEVTEVYGDSFNPKRENWEPITGGIEFRDVTFRYPDGTENVLEHFSLTIPAGTYVAIVGETGAGKSTLVNLVCRFFEPTEGAVLIDGRDSRERSQLWLHSSIGYVLQSPHLFSGTVRENIRYGRLDATDEEVEAAAKLVSADKVIEKLENGLDSDVGEGGDRLSTGEKQLISFARAVLANPRIFVLDEATSSIDTETEILIQRAVAHLLKGRTSFVIAHRLSTIRTADIILVVQNGKIIERGTHKELLRSRGHYYELYTRQFEEEIETKVLG
ncbi:MAG: ABC transporter ATP-binding protein/permease [Oscillospiraceae bacterium]|nr:ABC transporter ATP-binding protein/permease [Oscillospiraceae bacterium]